MSTPSKKRSETKKREELSKEFELPIATIKCILGRDRKVILNAIDEGADAKGARFQPCARNENVSISGPLIAEKAKELAKELHKHLREALE
uniref:Uncharacterized protein n=1 Tax=Ditylenchus dipsaci TaxID=166011 RepID=A0A915DR53_9BILA